jgi:hypothetical protein
VLPNTRRDAFRFSPEKDSLWHPVVLIVNYAAARRNRRRTGASDMIRSRACGWSAFTVIRLGDAVYAPVVLELPDTVEVTGGPALQDPGRRAWPHRHSGHREIRVGRHPGNEPTDDADLYRSPRLTSAGPAPHLPTGPLPRTRSSWCSWRPRSPRTATPKPRSPHPVTETGAARAGTWLRRRRKRFPEWCPSDLR